MLAGRPGFHTTIKLRFPYTLTPSPITNVKALNFPTLIPVTINKKIPSCLHFKDVLPEPLRPENLSSKVKWLAGEGAESWFYVRKKFDCFMISRYADDGNLEFESVYELLNSSTFDPLGDFPIIHLSHHLKIRIMQAGNVIEFGRIRNFRR